MKMKHFLLAGLIAAAPLVAHAQDVLIRSLTCTFTSAGPEVEGTIKNLTSQPLSDVNITSSFLDAKGNFINSGQDDIDYNPILPGQTSTFSNYGDVNPVITKVTITAGIDDGPELASSGVTAATCSMYPSPN